MVGTNITIIDGPLISIIAVIITVIIIIITIVLLIIISIGAFGWHQPLLSISRKKVTTATDVHYYMMI